MNNYLFTLTQITMSKELDTLDIASEIIETPADDLVQLDDFSLALVGGGEFFERSGISRNLHSLPRRRSSEQNLTPSTSLPKSSKPRPMTSSSWMTSLWPLSAAAKLS